MKINLLHPRSAFGLVGALIILVLIVIGVAGLVVIVEAIVSAIHRLVPDNGPLPLPEASNTVARVEMRLTVQASPTSPQEPGRGASACRFYRLEEGNWSLFWIAAMEKAEALRLLTELARAEGIHSTNATGWYKVEQPVVSEGLPQPTTTAGAED